MEEGEGSRRGRRRLFLCIIMRVLLYLNEREVGLGLGLGNVDIQCSI